ncbi:hypothetical protein [Candidatus Ichthyocystis hellenicum]|uniref:hypothetical protein n=1 Tax=Candidatus Ichthyocystis hellenicum TaxID=1561003 RepID=UPI000B86D405|nr:hypothetical protein [Candidatus Ichthyocystis hellenicum]
MDRIIDRTKNQPSTSSTNWHGSSDTKDTEPSVLLSLSTSEGVETSVLLSTSADEDRDELCEVICETASSSHGSEELSGDELCEVICETTSSSHGNEELSGDELCEVICETASSGRGNEGSTRNELCEVICETASSSHENEELPTVTLDLSTNGSPSCLICFFEIICEVISICRGNR